MLPGHPVETRGLNDTHAGLGALPPSGAGWSPGRAVLWLILATTLLRLGFAASLGLGVDESYMVAAGRVLSLGYFDHPPAAWWLAWGAGQTFGETAFTVRLPFIALFALSTWLMYRLGAAYADARVGFWAAFALNFSPVLGVTTASWVLPDGPLDCALVGAALCLMHALAGRDQGGGRGWWLGAGLCAGLALFSKYSAGLTIAGAILFLLSSRAHRHWLARPEPYLAGLVALAVFGPVLIWNATHGWASFAFQAARAGGARFRPFLPLETLAGEALFLLPWIWLPMMWALFQALRRGPAEWRGWLLCCLGLPPIVVFAAISAWSSQRVLFHWAAPGYLLLFPLLGALIVRLRDGGSRIVRPILTFTALLVVLCVLVLATAVRFDWLHPVIARINPKTDPTAEALDWISLRDDLAARGLLARPDTVIGALNWRDAGKIAFALGADVTVVVLNADARQFGMIRPASEQIGRDMVVLVPSHADRAEARILPMFATVEALPPASIRHAGRVVAEVPMFLGRRLLAWPPE